MSNSLRKIRRQNTDLKRNPPVLIVRPHRKDWNICGHTSEWIRAQIIRGIADEEFYATDSPQLARNQGIKVFLNDKKHEKKTHILFLDDDTQPYSPVAIDTLLHHNLPVVSGVTPIMREGLDACLKPTSTDCYWNAIPEKDGKLETIGINELPKSLFKAKRVGGSCVLIRRDVLQKLKPPYQKFTYDEENIHVTMSEDIYFSEKIYEAGFEIWADPEVKCHHYHNGIDILEVFNMLRQANEKGLKGIRL